MSSSEAIMQTNPRGIPNAPFVENVEEFVPPGEVELTLKKFQEMISKYKYMEVHLLQRKKNLELKVPELKKTLEMVQFLVSKNESGESIDTQFELNDTLWAKASIKPEGKVCLWLGANVMLEYSTTEASDLLLEKNEMATQRLIEVSEDLDFLRDQITVMDVNTARIHNWDVKNRRIGKGK